MSRLIAIALAFALVGVFASGLLYWHGYREERTMEAKLEAERAASLALEIKFANDAFKRAVEMAERSRELSMQLRTDRDHAEIIWEIRMLRARYERDSRIAEARMKFAPAAGR